jgi:tRNA(fMet)-specific endonuclease VapC
MEESALVRFMLDANALILLLAGDDRLSARAGNCDADDLCLSAITFAEVAHGSATGEPPPGEILRRVRERIPVLPFDAPAADKYAHLPFRRHRFDRLIAAHALSLELTLVTANTRDFRGIPSLKVEDWTK